MDPELMEYLDCMNQALLARSDALLATQETMIQQLAAHSAHLRDLRECKPDLEAVAAEFGNGKPALEHATTSTASLLLATDVPNANSEVPTPARHSPDQGTSAPDLAPTQAAFTPTLKAATSCIPMSPIRCSTGGLDHNTDRDDPMASRLLPGSAPTPFTMPQDASPTLSLRVFVALELDFKAPTRYSIKCSNGLDMPAFWPGATSNIEIERQVLRPAPWPSFISNTLAHTKSNGLGAEIAKNLALAGVKSVTIHDVKSVEMWDLSGNFLLSEADIRKNRAVACVAKLQELNNAVLISALTEELTTEHLSKFQAVVFTDIDLEKAYGFDDYCHSHQPPISFIKSEICGLFGSVLCDFGPKFNVLDVDGEDPHTGIIASISNDNPALVSCVDDERLEFQDDDLVVFFEVHGMAELNDGKPRKVKNARPFSFSIEQDTSNFGIYRKGGIVTQVKEPKVLCFKALRDAMRDPGDFLRSDFSKFDRPPVLHLAFQALDKFKKDYGRYPASGCEQDAQSLLKIAAAINEASVDRKLDTIDEKLFRQFASGSRAVLNPMAAMFGGIVGQEVVKACSEKFHPLYQFFYFDAVESLPTYPLDPQDLKPSNSRYDAQVSIFGSKLQKKLEEANTFVVGSGALGCDFLKNSPTSELPVPDEDVYMHEDTQAAIYVHMSWDPGGVTMPAFNLQSSKILMSMLTSQEAPAMSGMSFSQCSDQEHFQGGGECHRGRCRCRLCARLRRPQVLHQPLQRLPPRHLPDRVDICHAYCNPVVQVNHDFELVKEHRVLWDPGGSRRRRLGVKPNFKEGGMLGALLTCTLTWAFLLGQLMDLAAAATNSWEKATYWLS